MKKLIAKFIGIYFNLATCIVPKKTREQAFRLLSKVKRVPISEQGAVFFESGTTTYYEVQGYHTALHHWGGGPKRILFLHGWMSHSERWREFVEVLDPDHYTCFALDAPGHGNSEGNMLNLELYRQAYELALKKTGEVDVLVAHSFGSLVAAYQYLYDQEVSVNSYVIMGSPSGMDFIYQYSRDTLGLSQAMMRNLAIKANEVLKVPVEKLHLSEFLKENVCPKLVVHEISDPITPIEPIRKGVAGGTSVSHLFTNGLDHTLKSQEVIKRVIDFIETTTKDKEHVLERV